MLKCSKCKVEKPFESFNKNRSHKSGYSNQCRDCLKAYRKSRRMPTQEEARDFYKEEVASGREYTCKKCCVTSTADRFYYKRDYGVTKIAVSMCRPCNHKLSRLNTYGVTDEDYSDMLEAQDYSCAICGISERDYRDKYNKSLAVDHCHTTNKVRALLCEWCNKGLGHFYDNPDLLRKAANYLEIKR